MFSLSFSAHHAIQTFLCNIMCIVMVITFPLPEIYTKYIDKSSVVLIVVVISSVNTYYQGKTSLQADSTEQSKYSEIFGMENKLVDIVQKNIGVFQRIEKNTMTKKDCGIYHKIVTLDETMLKTVEKLNELQREKNLCEISKEEIQKICSDKAMQSTRISMCVIVCTSACMTSMAHYPQLWKNFVDSMVYYKSQMQRVLQ